MTGIKTAVKFLAGEDCGCDERREKLNKMFPFAPKDVECLNEEEFDFLSETLNQIQKEGQVHPRHMKRLFEIYKRFFPEDYKKQPGLCSSCWVRIFKGLRGLMEAYRAEPEAETNSDIQK